MIRLGSKVNLLICQKSKIADWINHMINYEDHFKMIYDCTKWNKDDWKAFAKNPNEPCVLVINYELAFRRPDLLKLKNFTLMLDESSMIQNETVKRSKFILKLKPDNVILLSGTPTSGKYENLFSQLNLLGWTISKDLYWKQYIETEWYENDGFFTKLVTGYKNVDRLKQKLRDHGAIFIKTDEVIDLPSQNHNTVWIKTSKDYWTFTKKSIIEMSDRNLIGDTILTKMLYSRMLCGHYNEDKLEAFEDLVCSTEDRLIVFYNFNDELAELAMIAESEGRPISIVNGHTKDLTAYEQYDNSVTFIQYQAGSLGLNLQKANKTIYFTLPLSSELFEQSKKRTHRLGQEKPCFYYYMMCRGSIEEKIMKTLEMRRNYTDDLFRSDYGV